MEEVAGLLEFTILGLLHDTPMHGYELRKRLADLLGTFRAFSYGSLYPTLKRMSDAGWIVDEEPLTAPVGDDAAKAATRRKRVYRLTAEGKEHFSELLAEVGPDAFDDGGFGARLAFFGQTRSDVRLRILEGRRRRVEERREGIAARRTTERLDRYTRQLHEHGLESVEREVRWLEELIDMERRELSRPHPHHEIRTEKEQP